MVSAFHFASVELCRLVIPNPSGIILGVAPSHHQHCCILRFPWSQPTPCKAQKTGDMSGIRPIGWYATYEQWAWRTRWLPVGYRLPPTTTLWCSSNFAKDSVTSGTSRRFLDWENSVDWNSFTANRYITIVEVLRRHGEFSTKIDFC